MGDEDELQVFLKTGKCCQCEASLANSKHLNIVNLDKKAAWKFPTWGNVLVKGSGGRAVAIVCDACVDSTRHSGGFKPKYAVEIGSHEVKEGKYLTRTIYDYVKYHKIEKLEDTFEITEAMVMEGERFYGFRD